MAERRRHKKRIQVARRGRGTGGGLERPGTKRDRRRRPERPGAGRPSSRGRSAVTVPRRDGASGRSAEGSVAGEGGREARRSNPASGPAFLRRRARACAGSRPPPERGRQAPASPPSSVSPWRPDMKATVAGVEGGLTCGPAAGSLCLQTVGPSVRWPRPARPQGSFQMLSGVCPPFPSQWLF